MSNVPLQTLNKWRKLADGLLLLTNKGLLKWKESAKDGLFITTLRDNTVQIEETYGTSSQGQQIPLVVIKIFDLLENEVDSFSDEEIGDQYFGQLRDMIRLIQREASGAERVLDDILAELEQRDPDHIPF